MDKKSTKILLVEDDINLSFVIQDNLRSAGFEVKLAMDGKQGLQSFHNSNFDICILDIMLPKQDGFSLAEDIRKLDNNLPLIFLTAKSMPEDKIKGFKSGADDYMTKPFSMEELILRIKAIIKRSKSNSEAKKGYHLGNLFFDSVNFQLLGKDKKILTKKEAEILKILCDQIGEVVERSLILKLVWGDDNYFNGRSLDVFISKLRKYLDEDPCVSINNIHGIGFSLQSNQQ